MTLHVLNGPNGTTLSASSWYLKWCRPDSLYGWLLQVLWDKVATFLLQIFHSILLSKIPMKLGVLHSPLWLGQYAWEWLPNPYARWQVKDLNPAWILIDDGGNKPLSRKITPCSTTRGVITMRGLEMRRNSFKTHCCILGAYCSWETLNLFS